MRVRVLSATSAPAAKPELVEGEVVDLPDEDALALVEAGTAEAVDAADVDKVKQAIEDRHATAKEQFQAIEDAEASARKAAGKPDEDKPAEDDKPTGHSTDKKVDDKDTSINKVK